MGECEKVGKMRFYPKPDARPNSRADLSTETIVSESSPFSSPFARPPASTGAMPRQPGPAHAGGMSTTTDAAAKRSPATARPARRWAATTAARRHGPDRFPLPAAARREPDLNRPAS
ncbi:hypothetical protein [Burkholderia gladioli]|uniref:hypothetical protein n=1 Tax=Burkholderia gladioli TaxID=28095 RepID=UPI00163F4187|nr:hypothetical protein [Burkholderia gladioli]MDA0571139.1 hypothetical protein [Burkholderia gladioli]MDA0599125.1 hypothetical protein [Burkholderia gladioli]